jgi:hypothetical protein
VRMQTYQAALARAENVAHVHSARRAIERIGGKVQIDPPAKNGIVIVTLHLPEGHLPSDYLPGLPFYPT